MFDYRGSCPHIPTCHTLGPLSGVGLPTFGAKQVAVAGDVAVGDAVMLGHREKREPSQLGSLPISSLPPPDISTHPCPVHLSMTPSSQGLPAALAPQTGSVPVSTQRHHLLSWWWRELVILGQGNETYLLCTTSLHFDAHPLPSSPSFPLLLTKIDRFLAAWAQ